MRIRRVLILSICLILPMSYALGEPTNEIELLSDSINIQENAIQALNRLSSGEKPDSDRAAALLQKTIENQEKLSALQFELAHLKASREKKNTDPILTDYKKTLNETVISCTSYLNRFPRSTETQAILLVRAKTYQTQEKNDLAETDFATLAFSKPKTDTTSIASLALVYLRYDLGKYDSVIETVNQLNIKPEDPHFVEMQVKRASALEKKHQYTEALKAIQGTLGVAVDRALKSKNTDHSNLRDAVKPQPKSMQLPSQITSPVSP